MVAVGLTVSVAPVCPAITLEPSVLPVPHWYTPPEAEVPPVAVKVTLLPVHIPVPAPVILVTAVDTAVTFTVVVICPIMVLHGVLSTLVTQYPVIVVGLTVIDGPVAPAMMFTPSV